MKKLTVQIDDNCFEILENLKQNKGSSYRFSIEKALKLLEKEDAGLTRFDDVGGESGVPALDSLLIELRHSAKIKEKGTKS